MKIDMSTKVALWIIAVMLFLNFARSLLPSKTALALPETENKGRYQITSWAAYGGGFMHHNGYYVLDTMTGKLVDEKAEVHDKGK